MCLPERVLVYGDCAVNVEPSSEELSQIAAVSADTAAAFGIEPRVALLSYSTGGSGAGKQASPRAAGRWGGWRSASSRGLPASLPASKRSPS
jgi:phosphotransacetylase